MAGDMHLPVSAPSCWLDPRQHPPADLPIRQAWCRDGGASCGGASAADDRSRLLHHDPGCVGCSRLRRAVLVELGSVIPHERTITNPQKRAAA